MVAMVIVKYGLHTYDIQRENPWEDKAVFLLYAELVIGNEQITHTLRLKSYSFDCVYLVGIGFVKVILYMMFMLIMIRVYTLPLFAVRPMYLAMRWVCFGYLFYLFWMEHYY